MDVSVATNQELLTELVSRVQDVPFQPDNPADAKFWKAVRFMLSVDKRDVRAEAKKVNMNLAMKINAIIPSQVDLRQVRCVLWALSKVRDEAVAEVDRIKALEEGEGLLG